MYCGISKVSTHAEEAVLNKITKRKHLHGRLFILRVTTDNKGKIKFTNSKPCSECVKKIKASGIKKIAYSNDFGEIVYEKTSNLSNNHISSAQLFAFNKKI